MAWLEGGAWAAVELVRTAWENEALGMTPLRSVTWAVCVATGYVILRRSGLLGVPAGLLQSSVAGVSQGQWALYAVLLAKSRLLGDTEDGSTAQSFRKTVHEHELVRPKSPKMMGCPPSAPSIALSVGQFLVTSGVANSASVFIDCSLRNFTARLQSRLEPCERISGH